MYAIVDIAGQQFKVEKDQTIYVNRLIGDEGSKISFDRVLLIDDGGKVQVGTPLVKNMVVTASIVSHLKADKVKVFKKKRRKGYQVLNGHRQALTELLVEGIGEGKAEKTETAKKTVASEKKAPVASKAKPAPEKKEAPKAEAKKPAADKKTTAAKAEAKKPAATKKPSETKDGGKKPAATKSATTAKKPAAKKAPAAKKSAAKTAPKAKKADGDKSKK